MSAFSDVISDVIAGEGTKLLESTEMFGGSVVTIAYDSEYESEETLKSPPKPAGICVDGQDLWDVKSLHFDKVSEQIPSGAIKDLAESQNRAYFQALEDMKKELEEIKCDTEKTFRGDSEYVIAELENIKSSVQEKLEQLKAKDISKIEEDDFKNMEDHIKYSFQRHFKTVQSYYEDIMDNENQRNKKMKAAFKKWYAVLNGIYFTQPEGLQDYFDTLIQRANQSTLCNQQSYSEVYTNLLVQGKVQERCVKAKLAEHKRECEAWELEKLYKKIRETKYTEAPKDDSDYDTDKEPEEIVANLTSAEGMIETLMKLHEESSKSLEGLSTEKLTDGVQDVALFIDSRAKLILDMYRNAVQNIHAGLYEKSGEPREDTRIDIQKIRDLRNNIQTLLIPEIEREGGADATKHPWGQAMQTMEKNLEGFYDFLEGCMKVWDAHFIRVKDSQKKVLEELKSQIEKNDSGIDEKEIKLSKVLNALRQGNSEEKLMEKLQNVADILVEIKTLHEQNCQSEAKCIAEYKSYVDPLSNSLASEIKDVLKSSPPQRNIALQYAKKAPAANAQVTSLPRIMRLCEMQVSAIENWKYGLWIAMLQYRKKSNSELDQMACNWIETEIRKAQERLETKLSIHDTRYDHIVSEIYNIRLVELRLHMQRLQQHQEGVAKALNDLDSQLNELVSKLNEELQNLKTSLAEDEQAAKEFKQSGLAYSKMQQLGSLANTYTDKISKAMEAFQTECEDKLSMLHDSNVKYMESIKYFSEDGNFTVEEAKKYTAALADIKKVINKSIKNTEMQALKKKKGLIQEGKAQIEWKIEIMKKIGDELQFSEKSMEVLRKTQTKIRGEVFELKYKTQLLNDAAVELLSSIPYYSEMHESLSKLCEKWQCLMKKVLSVRDYLLQPSSEIKDDTGATSCNMPLKFISHIDTAEAKTAASVIKFKNKNFKDYKKFLFGITELPADSSFMSNICAILWQSFSELQQLSCEFYANRTSSSIIKSDITQPRHDLFMKEILIKLKYHHAQCEDIWMMHAQDYLNMMIQLKEAVNDYGPTCIEDAHSRNMNTLTKIAEKCTSTLEQETQKHFQNLRAKFKLLLGYPRNDEILEDLDESALASCSALKTSVSGISSKYKTKMVEKSEFLSSDLLSLQDSIHSIISDVFDPLVTEIMMQQVTEVEEPIPSSVSKESAAEKTEKDDETLSKTETDRSTSTKSTKKGKDKKKKGKDKKKKEKGKKDKAAAKGKDKGKAGKEDAPQHIQIDIDKKNIPIEHKIDMSTENLCTELNEMCAIALACIGESLGSCAKSRSRYLDISKDYKKKCLQPCLESIEDEHLDSLIQEYKDVVESFERSAEMQVACYMKTTEEWLRVWKLNMQQAKQSLSL